MLRVASLAASLFVTWLLLSGHFDNAILLGLGVISVIVTVIIAKRMGLIDEEGHPTGLGPRILIFWPWLVVEILKSNFDVARRALSPRMDVSPTTIRLPLRLRSDVGRVVYANSITLTPGTVSLFVEPDSIVVHALTRHGASSLANGEMERRVAAFMKEQSS